MRRAAERDVLEVEGDVVELGRGFFYVRVPTLGRQVICKLSGRMHTAHIRIVCGDRVRVEIGAYDLSRGRIVRRL